MDAIREPASTVTDASRSFPTELVMTTLFDCPLWPSTDLHPNVLVNFMARLNQPSLTLAAYTECRQSLARQFPQLTQPCDAHLEVWTLYRHLTFHAKVRAEELVHWIDDISSVPVTLEVAYEWADELDWFLCAHPDRRAALRLWFHRLKRSKMKALANVSKSTLEAALPELDALYRRRADEARHTHGIWLQTRRCVADVPQHVRVRPLEYTYAQNHQDVHHPESSKGPQVMPFTWGRLEHFRAESKYAPAIN